MELPVMSRISPRLQRIDALLKQRSRVFAEVERTQGTAEVESHFVEWRALTKQIESLQESLAG